MKRTGFDNDAYIKRQSGEIIKRIGRFGGKLYLEFGGKLYDDYHASRVLPGFQPDSKLKMLRMISDQVEIIIAISAVDIEKNKIRGDLGITYDTDVIRLIDAFRGFDLYVGSVVITQYSGQPSAEAFKAKMERLGMPVYLHYPIEGYPTNVQMIVSEEGYGKNQYIETSRPLVVVTAPGPGSGKMATCLSQLYHENKRGIQAGYAKFETFPIWNMPLKHPVNLAYEAATADLNDVNMIDPYHLDAYGITTVNYNRDIEIFPVLRAMFRRIYGECPYKSPTDMGVNMAGYCITDDAAVSEASCQEIIRRYYKAMSDYRKGLCSDEPMNKIEMLMEERGLTRDARPVIKAALDREQETGSPAIAIQLSDGRIATGKTSELMGPASAALLNAVKVLEGTPRSVHFISPETISPIQRLKVNLLGGKNPRLHSDEILIALSMSAATDKNAERAFVRLADLRGCEAHSTVLLSSVDEDIYRRLGINLTCEPRYESKRLFYK
ncbi:MAG: DUF1846 domain-containing protein [Clostridiaceae bacterium]|nr:DUF1846 domain-containing protein [Clostridiaceae bacterium]